MTTKVVTRPKKKAKVKTSYRRRMELPPVEFESVEVHYCDIQETEQVQVLYGSHVTYDESPELLSFFSDDGGVIMIQKSNLVYARFGQHPLSKTTESPVNEVADTDRNDRRPRIGG